MEDNFNKLTKIQNDHASILLHWNIRIDYQDDWWKISPESSQNGCLNPGENVEINIEIDRTGKEDGEYWSGFVVESYGTDYSFDKQVTLIMEVGNSPDSLGPELINISTNTGNNLDRVVLCFDKFIASYSAHDIEKYIISPPIEISYASIRYNKITLRTAEHAYDTDYKIYIQPIKDTRDRESTDLEGEYRFYYCCAGSDLNISGSVRRYEWDVVLLDKRIYTDRDYVLGQVPAEYVGCAMLRTGCDDMMQDSLLISFTINCDSAKVILAYDPRKSSTWNCSWMETGYTRLPTNLPVNGIADIEHFELYQSINTYRQDQTITLYQNGGLTQDNLMYFVLVKKYDSTINISGNVSYYSSNNGVQNTTMKLMTNMADSMKTDTSGYYNFTNLQKGINYTITPSKTGDISMTTIMMYDAALAAQIACEMIQQPSDAQRIAADVNKDGTVSMDDASMIAMHVVGLSPHSESRVSHWVFQPTACSYPALNYNQTNQDYTAIVLGDVDGNWTPVDSLSEEFTSKVQYTFYTDF